MTPINPQIGEVGIPYGGDVAVGQLGARALAWIEHALAATSFTRDVLGAAITENGPQFGAEQAATILWAALEHQRRRAGRPGPEYTIDDGYALVDQHGIDGIQSYLFALVMLSAPYRARADEAERRAAEAGEPDLLDPLRAMATNGNTSSSSPTEPASAPTSSGS